MTTSFLPKEPKFNTNTYLRSEGVHMQLASGIHTIVRAALICVTCDIPATRKVALLVIQHIMHAPDV